MKLIKNILTGNSRRDNLNLDRASDTDGYLGGVDLGLVGVGVGIITFAAPAVSAIVLLFYIAAWSLATGIMEIAQAIRLSKEIQKEIWLMLSGIVSIFFAVLLMLFPGAGALGVIWLIFIYAILFATAPSRIRNRYFGLHTTW